MNSEENIQEDNVSTLRKRLRFAGNAAIAIVTAVLVGFVVYIMICSSKGRPVSVFGRSMLKVVTGSMEPSLQVGDYIYIKDTPADELEVGDVITFRSEEPDVYGKLVTHRIIEVRPDGTFVTKGDANSTADRKAVRSDQIYGRYTGKARFYRWIGSFADRKKLLLILVMIPMLAAALYEVRTISRITRDAVRKKKEAAEEEHEALLREAIEKEKERLAQENLSEEELLRMKEAAEAPHDDGPEALDAPEEENVPETDDEFPEEESVPETEDELPEEESVPGTEDELPEEEASDDDDRDNRTASDAERGDDA